MGPLAGIRVVEVSHELSAWTGKLMADMDADVIVVEPPGGSDMRTYAPFADDIEDPENSLFWWHYNTSKQGVVLDRGCSEGAAAFADLVASADVLLGAEPLSSFGESNPALITVSLTAPVPITDLTILAAGGPVHACGYDDHSLPPVRGGGNQGFHTACHWATIATLIAVLEREESGRGQHIDVDAVAAAQVTTEVSTYGWLACTYFAERQTGRHAANTRTSPTQLRCADGLYVNSGVIARRGPEFEATLRWLEELGLLDTFDMTVFLEMGAKRAFLTMADFANDPEAQLIAEAARAAQAHVAEHVSAYEFFISAQRHGLTAGIIYAPDEVLADPHFLAREWPQAVEHPEHGRTVTYPGQPYRFTGTPAGIRHRAPRLGEHQAIVESG
jgi:crotonobetainyl-CoA:carnitine CoA-transferase CaiB-like acyl-CoA transferase